MATRIDSTTGSWELDKMEGSLKHRTLENIGYNVCTKVITFLSQMVANIVLARNLTSSDYGIVSFGLVYIGFLALFSDLGIQSAIIQRERLDERGLYTGFTIKIVLGMGLTAASFLLAVFAPIFFEQRAVEDVIRLLSLNFLIGSFSFLPSSLLTRELNYRRLLIPQSLSGVANSMVSIILALMGFKYWSIVIANLSAVIVSVILLNFVRPVKIRFCLDRKVASELLHFGGYLFASGILIFGLYNADNFIIGFLKGSTILGYYALAFSWGTLICLILEAVVVSVLFPTFSKIQQDRERIRTAYLEALEYISFFGVLGYVGLAVVSREFLYFVLGHGSDKWFPALTSLRILCVYGVLRVILVPVGSVLLALGETALLFKSNLLAAVLEIGLLYPALKYHGIEGVAVVVTAAYACQYLVYFPILKGKMNLSFQNLFESIRAPLLAGLAMGGILLLISSGSLWGFSRFSLWMKLILSPVLYFIFHGAMTQWKLVKDARSLISHWRGERVQGP